MNITALLYIDDNLHNNDLGFAGTFLPEELKKRLSSNNKLTAIKYSVSQNYSGNLNTDLYKREDKDDVSFWKGIFSELNADHIIKIFCDSPFMDMEIIEDMIDVHIKYLAEFTYSENLHPGFRAIDG